MIDGPKNGEILTTDGPISDVVCFAIPVTMPMPWEPQPDPTKYNPAPTANYRRIGRTFGKSGMIDVYEFVGMA